MIHCDIKPSIILFDEEDQLILTDFGIAKILETDETTLTSTGVGVGTPEYMAPEQWRGQASPATDQYALGVVLYELLTGQKPYKADTPAAVAIMQATEPLRSPSTIVPGVPDPVEKLLLKALARDPQDRFADMVAFRKALEKQLKEETSEPIKPVETLKQPTPLLGAKPSPIPVSEAETVDEFEPKRAQAVNRSRKTSELISQTTRKGTGDQPILIKNSKEPEELKIQLNPDVSMTFVHVPAGEFWMGSDDAFAREDEQPMHKVYLNEYWIGQTPVTNNQYGIFCKEVGKNHWSIKNAVDFPVVNISWHDATAFCDWLSRKSNNSIRLPTEAEWEKAARGTDGRKYPWGNQKPTCSLANFDGCEGGITPVGNYPEGTSPYGALDMSGNVWEWVADWLDETYYNRAPNENPTGPEAGTYRVVRGGSWYLDVRDLRVSFRGCLNPDDSYIYFGFRCLRSP